MICQYIKQTLILFSFFTVVFSTFGQEGDLSDDAIKFEKRFIQAKQDFVDNNHEKVVSYYDSIISIQGNTGITTYKMAFNSYNELILKYPEHKDSLKTKAAGVYDEAIKWYGNMFVDENWKNVIIDPNKKSNYLKEVDKQPEYPGGLSAFYSYIQSNLSYPTEAKQMGIEGKVYVKFMINKDGSIDAVNVVRGIGSGCDAEAIRIVRNAKKFTPGMTNGQPQFVRVLLPINFELISTYESKKRKRKNKS